MALLDYFVDFVFNYSKKIRVFKIEDRRISFSIESSEETSILPDESYFTCSISIPTGWL